MKILHLNAAFAVAALFAAAVAGTAARAQTMDQVLEGAKKEGEVIIHVGPGKQFRDGRLKGFEEKYPFLKVHAINTANRESMPKLIRERQAGIYSLDVHMGGSPNLVRVYRPQGFLTPFRDAIVDKSLLDDKVWNGGFAGGFQDTGGQYIYAYNMVTNNLGHVNWSAVSKNDIKSLEDVLKPNLVTKIVWHDPRSPGPGFATAMAIYFSYGEEFLTKLFQQKSVFTNNRRQAAEWVVRGRYPIGLGTSRDFMVPFEQQGLTKNVIGNAGGVGQDADHELRQRQHRDDGQGAPSQRGQALHQLVPAEGTTAAMDRPDRQREPPPRHQAGQARPRARAGQAIHRHFP